MAINFQQVREKIGQIGAGAAGRQKALQERQAEARRLLKANASALEKLRARVESAKGADANLRCAVPLTEALDSSIPAPALPEQATLIAADGSQINPSRHEQIQFGLVNAGGIVLRLNSGESTLLHTDSKLMYDDELFRDGVPLSEGMVALERDLQERGLLAELAKGQEPPVVTFTDGPIELWGARDGQEAKAYAESLDKYKGVLSRLQSLGVITAGYVDKPASDLVVRLLELALAAPKDMESLRNFRPLRGVSDRFLFGDHRELLLQPGHRSAVFSIQSSSAKNYQGILSLHFFYLNAGMDEAHPHIARVEIPHWVAEDAGMLGLLHAVLVDQCRIMGAKPYPYLLHRAHETAVVSNEEKFQVEQMLMQELRRQGVDVEEGSNKQSAKDLPGRSR
jgi:NurA domain